MSIKTDLQKTVGDEFVTDEPETLKRYASDQSFVEPRMPEVAVFARSVEDVQEVVKYGNRTRTPVVPFSSGLNMHGGTVPREGGIVLDMTGMNRIHLIDTKNRQAVIEPGVTAAQLQDELEKHQLRAMLPFGIHPRRSALTSYLERDPSLASASFEYGNELIMDTEIVMPTGELFRTGLWSTGGTPGSPMGPVKAMINRLWTGAQGTFGILTKMNIKVEYLPRKRSLFLFQFDSFPEAMEPLKMIQRKEIGHECFLINSFNTAALLCRDWQVPDHFPAEPTPSSQFQSLCDSLPPWLLVVCSNGGPRMPEGKLAYEQEALNDIASVLNLQMHRDGELEKVLLSEMLRPWGILKKYCYRGSVHDLNFKTTLKRIPEFQAIVMEIINKYSYPLRDVGVFVMPVERGRAFHCEADFHCDGKGEAFLKVKNMWLEASERLINEGAFFDRPYGHWADMVYRRAGTYTQKLKQLKKELDPNNILNPGKLCF